MKLRPVIFWAHLVVGVAAGLVVAVMAATGALLTYERQLVEWSEQRYAVPSRAGEPRLTADELLAVVRRAHPDEHHLYLRSVNRPGAAVPAWAGDHAYLLDPWTGAILRDGEGVLGEFFRFVTRLHRTLALEGAWRGVGQTVTAYGNLALLVLIATGIYLWLPRVWRWPAVRPKMFFNPKAETAKARDFNWHHVFSFWSLVPVALMALTATIFYFTWANAVLYGAFGEDIPVREQHPELEVLEDGALSYEALLDLAKAHAAEHDARDWYSIWLELGTAPGEVEFYIDRSIGRKPEVAYSLVLAADDGKVLKVSREADWSRGDQAWTFARYLHTGEAFGVVGQTIAGLASLAALLLVYTGLALAWRRLIVPLFRSLPRAP